MQLYAMLWFKRSLCDRRVDTTSSILLCLIAMKLVVDVLGESTRSLVSTLFDSPETFDWEYLTVLPKWWTDITMPFQDFLLLFQSCLVHELTLQTASPQCWGLFQENCSAVKYVCGCAGTGFNRHCHTIHFTILLMMYGEPASFVGQKAGAWKNAAAAG